jgi:hypothetical protein
MHIEILVEDSSGKALLLHILPHILGGQGEPHTWKLHAYKGVGRLPPGLDSRSDPSKRILLDQLAKLLRGYGKTPGIDAVVVVLDADRRDCRTFLNELNGVASATTPSPRTLFRLAIEEMEAWYFGDQEAIQGAFPKAKRNLLESYRQDSVCNTWEALADAVYPGGSAAIKRAGGPLPGQVKHDWAEKIGPLMVLDRNRSPSFGKLRDGLRRLIAG